MKKVTMLFAFLALLSHVKAQNAQRQADGNYLAVKTARIKDTVLNSTGHTYTDAKKVVYPVYISKNGKLFIVRTSAKTGNVYHQYLKLDQ